MENAKFVDYSDLAENIGTTVRFVGKIKSIADNVATLISYEGKEVDCILTEEINTESPFLEVYARVNEDMTLEQESSAFPREKHDSALALDACKILNNQKLRKYLFDLEQ